MKNCDIFWVHCDLDTLNILHKLTLSNHPGSRYYCLHFTDEETKSQSLMARPKLCSCVRVDVDKKNISFWFQSLCSFYSMEMILSVSEWDMQYLKSQLRKWVTWKHLFFICSEMKWKWLSFWKSLSHWCQQPSHPTKKIISAAGGITGTHCPLF